MLLALTFSQVHAAKGFLGKSDEDKCRKALRYAMYHIKNALVLSEGTKKDYQIRIFAEMKEVVKDRSISNQKIEATVNRILLELDQSKVSFS